MDKKIDKLTATLEAFMQRFDGNQQVPKVVPEYRNYRPEQTQETTETIQEVKLIRNVTRRILYMLIKFYRAEIDTKKTIKATNTVNLIIKSQEELLQEIQQISEKT